MPSFSLGATLLLWYHADQITIPPVRYPWGYKSFRASLGYTSPDTFTTNYDPFTPGAKNTIPNLTDAQFLLVQKYFVAFGKVGNQGSSKKSVTKGTLTELQHAFLKSSRNEDGFDHARKLVTALGKKAWWEANGFNALVDKGLKERGIHPLQMLSAAFDAITGGFKISERHKPHMCEAIVEVIFGDEAFTDEDMGKLYYPTALDEGVNSILAIFWNRFHKHKTRIVKNYTNLKEKADNAITGKCSTSYQ